MFTIKKLHKTKIAHIIVVTLHTPDLKDVGARQAVHNTSNTITRSV